MLHPTWILLCLTGALTASLMAQGPDHTVSAFTGLQMVDKRFGGESLRKIVQMEGLDGRTQPKNWELVVYDPGSAFSLHNYVINHQKATDQGHNEYLYPNSPPTGFFEWSQVQIDSSAAFRILDAEARTAGMGFNSVNYLLRCREFTNEPIWDLTAVDAEGYPIGRVHLSAATGAVLRTIWYAWQPGREGAPTIADSALTAPKERPAPLPPLSQPPTPSVVGINPADRAVIPGTNPAMGQRPPVVEVEPSDTVTPAPGSIPVAIRPKLPTGSVSNSPVNSTTPAPAGTDPAAEGPPRALRPGTVEGSYDPGAMPPTYGGTSSTRVPAPETDPVQVEPLPSR